MKVMNESREGRKLRNFRFSKRSKRMVVPAKGVGQKSETNHVYERKDKTGKTLTKGRTRHPRIDPKPYEITATKRRRSMGKKEG